VHLSMFRRKLIIAVAMATFVVGAEFHLQIMRLAERIIRYDTIIFEEPEAQTSIDTDAIGLPFLDWCRVVVSMGGNRDLYVRREFVGRPDDTQQLQNGIVHEFDGCDQQLVEMQSKDLNAPVLTTRWRPRLVYLKLFRPYPQDVPRLVKLSKAAGADNIEVLFDKIKCGAARE